MKKINKRSLIVLAGILFAVVLVLIKIMPSGDSSKLSAKPPRKTQISQQPVGTLDNAKIQSLLSSSSDKSNLTSTPASPCRNTLMRLAEQKGVDLIREFINDKVPSNCINSISAKKFDLDKQKAKSACRWRPDTVECKIAMIGLQALIGTELAKGQDPKNLSTSLLTFQYMSSLLEYPKTDLKELLAIVDELDKRDPELGFSKSKLLIIPALIKDDPAHKQEYESQLADLERRFPDDALFKRLSNGIDSENVASLERQLDGYLERNPKDADAYYYKAVILHVKNDHSQALSYLTKASALQNGNSLYKESVATYKVNPEAWKPKYPIAMPMPGIDTSNSVVSKF